MQLEVGPLLKQISDKNKVSIDAALKSQNITLSQYRVLKYISDSNTGVTQKSIENYLKVSHPTVVGIVSRMEKNGYLRCHSDDKDKRNKIVEMTGQAARISHEMQDVVAAQEAKLLHGLTEEEIQSLYRMLHIMYKNVDEGEK